LTRRQARWSLFLAEYEFSLHHKPGCVNDIADTLSRRPDHKEGVEDDNSDRVLLKPGFFQLKAAKRGHILIEGEQSLLKRIRNSTDLDPEVQSAIETLKMAPVQLHKGIEEWNIEDKLVLFRGLVYIPNDKEICRAILEIFHDSPAAGHSGRAKTLELVSRTIGGPRCKNGSMTM
jgi:hypothetical protein